LQEEKNYFFLAIEGKFLGLSSQAKKTTDCFSDCRFRAIILIRDIMARKNHKAGKNHKIIMDVLISIVQLAIEIIRLVTVLR